MRAGTLTPIIKFGGQETPTPGVVFFMGGRAMLTLSGNLILSKVKLSLPHSILYMSQALGGEVSFNYVIGCSTVMSGYYTQVRTIGLNRSG